MPGLALRRMNPAVRTDQSDPTDPTDQLAPFTGRVVSPPIHRGVGSFFLLLGARGALGLLYGSRRPPRSGLTERDGRRLPHNSPRALSWRARLRRAARAPHFGHAPGRAGQISLDQQGPSATRPQPSTKRRFRFGGASPSRKAPPGLNDNQESKSMNARANNAPDEFGFIINQAPFMGIYRGE
jgi:hypothetical protein